MGVVVSRLVGRGVGAANGIVLVLVLVLVLGLDELGSDEEMGPGATGRFVDRSRSVRSESVTSSACAS